MFKKDKESEKERESRQQDYEYMIKPVKQMRETILSDKSKKFLGQGCCYPKLEEIIGNWDPYSFSSNYLLGVRFDIGELNNLHNLFDSLKLKIVKYLNQKYELSGVEIENNKFGLNLIRSYISDVKSLEPVAKAFNEYVEIVSNKEFQSIQQQFEEYIQEDVPKEYIKKLEGILGNLNS